MWFRKKKLYEEDPRALTLELLTIQHGAVMAKLFLVNSELQRRCEALGGLAGEIPAATESATYFRERADELRGFSIILEQLLSKGARPVLPTN